MRAARFHNRGDIRVEDVDEPGLRPGQVHVDVEWTGICGSELHEFLMGPVVVPVDPHPLTGEHIPLTLGHEVCGRVSNPPPGSRFREGEAVMVDPRITCDNCINCQEGKGHCCKTLGYVGGSASGGYGERVAVSEHRLHPLGDIPIEYAAVIEPLAIVHHAVKESGVEDWSEKTVLVLGGGPIGFALLLDLKAHGATKIIVSEPAKIRREQVAEFASSVINPVNEDVAGKCLEMTGGVGVDVVFDCAGVPAALEAAFNSIRVNGLYLMVAVWEEPLTLPCWQFLGKHITVKGVLLFNDEEFEEVMRWMAEGKLKGYEKMVTGRISIEDIVEKGFKELIHNKDKHIKILVTPKKSLLGS